MAERDNSYLLVQNFDKKLYNQTDLTHEQKVAIGYLLAAAKEMTKDYKSSEYLLEKIEKFLSYTAHEFKIPQLEPAQFFRALIMADKLHFEVADP